MTVPPVNVGGDFGKALGKFFHEISRHFGRFTESGLIVKNAKARAEEIKLLADANAYASRVSAQVEAENAKLLTTGSSSDSEIIVSREETVQSEVKQLVARTIADNIHDQIREQVNKENITAIAADTLEHEADENVSDEPVDPDWMARFFDMARHIGNEEMQQLWGQVLAGEVKQPGSYSLRTLDILKNISQTEAQTFVNLCRFALLTGGDAAIFFENDGKELGTQFDFHYGHVLLLAEAGFVTIQKFLVLRVPKGIEQVYTYGSKGIIIKAVNDTDFPAVIFTKPARELLSLVTPNIEIKYLYNFFKYLKGKEVFIKMGEIVEKLGPQIRLVGLHEVTQEEIETILGGT